MFDGLPKTNSAASYAQATGCTLLIHRVALDEQLNIDDYGYTAALSESGNTAYVATNPNNWDVVLEDVRMPAGIWGVPFDGKSEFSKLHALGPAFILCPEFGGFQQLLCAPEHFDAKDPVWQKGHMFGQARKPYCIAGVRWIPTNSVLFACDLFSDRAFGLSDNAKLFKRILYEVAAKKVFGIQSTGRPDHISAADSRFARFISVLHRM